jgi:hypothetical protein
MTHESVDRWNIHTNTTQSLSLLHCQIGQSRVAVLRGAKAQDSSIFRGMKVESGKGLTPLAEILIYMA